MNRAKLWQCIFESAATFSKRYKNVGERRQEHINARSAFAGLIPGERNYDFPVTAA